MKFNMISGTAFILLMGLNAALVQAADGREDAMCSAIFIQASEYYQVKLDEANAAVEEDVNTETIMDAARQGQQLNLHKSIAQMFEWNRARTGINFEAYLHQTEFYDRHLDTATALLHYDRCYHRGFDIYKVYRAANVQE